MSRLSSFSNEPIRLREVLPGAEVSAAGDVRARGCACDSRDCRPGDVFVALAGTRADGHDFAAEAVARGAVAVIAERPLAVDAPVCVVPDSHEALGLVCQALAGRPAKRCE